MRIWAKCLVVCVCAACFGADVDPSLRKALVKGAEARFELQVVDDEGAPVPAASVEFGFWNDYTFGGFKNNFLTTDSNGVCRVEGRCNGKCVWTAKKEGYYASRAEWSLAQTDSNPKVKDGKWQPYGGRREIRLKQIRKPGMCRPFFEKLRDKKIPLYGKWIGLDLEKCDWVRPYGTGEKDDILLRLSADYRNWQSFKFVIEGSFTNNPFAGAYILRKDKTSEFQTDYRADPQAKYVPSFLFEESCGGAALDKKETMLDSDSYMIFRTRTELDKNGNLISAHYGKICGRWLLDERTMTISDGCFNFVSNDTNIEDDMLLRNVFRGRQFDEQLKNSKKIRR